MTTEATVAERVRHIIATMAPRPAEFDGAADARERTDQLRLIEDLGFDSLRLMELTVVLEQSFALPRYRPEQLMGVLRVGQVVDLVTRTLEVSA